MGKRARRDKQKKGLRNTRNKKSSQLRQTAGKRSKIAQPKETERRIATEGGGRRRRAAITQYICQANLAPWRAGEGLMPGAGLSNLMWQHRRSNLQLVLDEKMAQKARNPANLVDLVAVAKHIRKQQNSKATHCRQRWQDT
jgi:hypothetical protein